MLQFCCSCAGAPLLPRQLAVIEQVPRKPEIRPPSSILLITLKCFTADVCLLNNFIYFYDNLNRILQKTLKLTTSSNLHGHNY